MEYDQIVTVELTTDQVLLSLSCVNSSLVEIKEWLDNSEKRSQYATYNDVKETYESLKRLLKVYENAKDNIESSWEG